MLGPLRDGKFPSELMALITSVADRVRLDGQGVLAIQRERWLFAALVRAVGTRNHLGFSSCASTPAVREIWICFWFSRSRRRVREAVMRSARASSAATLGAVAGM